MSVFDVFIQKCQFLMFLSKFQKSTEIIKNVTFSSKMSVFEEKHQKMQFFDIF